jgi:GNAT superfamily N-acetyltransferase
MKTEETKTSVAPADATLRELAFATPEYEASWHLRWRVLREPLGLLPGPHERDEESGLVHLGAFEGERLVATLMLHDVGEGRVRMRQVAVDFDRQRTGVGTKLVHFSEDVARGRGFGEMVLHARVTAVPFYERLGYQPYGEPFVEVTIPHLAMRMALYTGDRFDGS